MPATCPADCATLGRQDSNPGMAESKSTYFAFDFKDHSEKSANFDPFPIYRLDADSECATGAAQVLWCVLITLKRIVSSDENSTPASSRIFSKLCYS
jgi:hypothetical protein